MSASAFARRPHECNIKNLKPWCQAMVPCNPLLLPCMDAAPHRPVKREVRTHVSSRLRSACAVLLLAVDLAPGLPPGASSLLSQWCNLSYQLERLKSLSALHIPECCRCDDRGTRCGNLPASTTEFNSPLGKQTWVASSSHGSIRTTAEQNAAWSANWTFSSHSTPLCCTGANIWTRPMYARAVMALARGHFADNCFPDQLRLATLRPRARGHR